MFPESKIRVKCHICHNIQKMGYEYPYRRFDTYLSHTAHIGQRLEQLEAKHSCCTLKSETYRFGPTVKSIKIGLTH